MYHLSLHSGYDEPGNRESVITELLDRIEASAAVNFKTKTKFHTITTVWQYLSRLITVASIVMGTLIGTNQLDLEDTIVTSLGISLAVANALNGIVGEIINQLGRKITEIEEATTLATLAQVKLMKVLDATLQEGPIKRSDFQTLMNTITPTLKALSTIGLGKDKSD